MTYLPGELEMGFPCGDTEGQGRVGPKRYLYAQASYLPCCLGFGEIETYSVDQASLKHTELRLFLPPLLVGWGNQLTGRDSP